MAKGEAIAMPRGLLMTHAHSCVQTFEADELDLSQQCLDVRLTECAHCVRLLSCCSIYFFYALH